MFDTVNGVLRVRKWPKKKKKRRSAEEIEREEAFRQAQWLTKIFMPDLMVECMNATAGTPLMPRDLGTLIIYNLLTYFLLPDGTRIYPTVAREDVSESLDVLEQRPFYMLYRGATYWQGLAPGPNGQVLYSSGPDAAPVWGALPDPPPPVGAQYALLGEASAPSGGGPALTVSGIDQTYTDLIVSCMLRGSAALDSVNIFMRFNNSALFKYDYNRSNRFGAVANQDQDRIDVGGAPAANAINGMAAPVELTIPRYHEGGFFRAGSGTSYLRQLAAPAGIIAQYVGFDWQSNAAIDRIDIFPSSGNWVSGSHLSVYGRK